MKIYSTSARSFSHCCTRSKEIEVNWRLKCQSGFHQMEAFIIQNNLTLFRAIKVTQRSSFIYCPSFRPPVLVRSTFSWLLLTDLSFRHLNGQWSLLLELCNYLRNSWEEKTFSVVIMSPAASVSWFTPCFYFCWVGFNSQTKVDEHSSSCPPTFTKSCSCLFWRPKALKPSSFFPPCLQTLLPEGGDWRLRPPLLSSFHRPYSSSPSSSCVGLFFLPPILVAFMDVSLLPAALTCFLFLLSLFCFSVYFFVKTL